MDDHISRACDNEYIAKKEFKKNCIEVLEHIRKHPTMTLKEMHVVAAIKTVCEIINDTPAADVVSRDCFNRILAENDVMREQLAGIGKKPGDKMDDVRRVLHGEWVYGEFDIPHCSECGTEVLPHDISEHCPTCGAKMDCEEE